MRVTSTAFTVAEYCEQMKKGAIIVNRDYQRSDDVWPPAARSYLIDTILLGYPIPKISLYQKTDLKSRKTTKEIVDGQQRSKVILDFYEGKHRITGRSSYGGKKYSDLQEPAKRKFISYSLSVDVFTAANDDDIREMFRRINSYTVPLNPEEQRHATHQGKFKWFIVDVTETYAPTLKELGIFTERRLSRMQDARFFTELVLALDEGIQTYSKKKLDGCYEKYDKRFEKQGSFRKRIELAFDRLLAWEEIHNGVLMKPYNAHSLLLAILYCAGHAPALEDSTDPGPSDLGPDEIVLANLGALSEVLEEGEGGEEEDEEEDEEEGEEESAFAEFVKACSGGTNTKEHRETRFRWFCRALQSELII